MKIVDQSSLIVPFIVLLREAPVAIGQQCKNGGVDVIIDVVQAVGGLEIDDVGPVVSPVAIGLDDVLFVVGEHVGKLQYY